MMESLITSYDKQRQQIDEFLRQDPLNSQFLQLKKDLDDAEALTRSLLAAHEDDDNEGVGEQPSDDEDDGDNTAFIKAILPQITGDLQPNDIIEARVQVDPLFLVILSFTFTFL